MRLIGSGVNNVSHLSARQERRLPYSPIKTENLFCTQTCFDYSLCLFQVTDCFVRHSLSLLEMMDAQQRTRRQPHKLKAGGVDGKLVFMASDVLYNNIAMGVKLAVTLSQAGWYWPIDSVRLFSLVQREVRKKRE